MHEIEPPFDSTLPLNTKKLLPSIIGGTETSNRGMQRGALHFIAPFNSCFQIVNLREVFRRRSIQGP